MEFSTNTVVKAISSICHQDCLAITYDTETYYITSIVLCLPPDTWILKKDSFSVELISYATKWLTDRVVLAPSHSGQQKNDCDSSPMTQVTWLSPAQWHDSVTLLCLSGCCWHGNDMSAGVASAADVLVSCKWSVIECEQVKYHRMWANEVSLNVNKWSVIECEPMKCHQM